MPLVSRNMLNVGATRHIELSVCEYACNFIDGGILYVWCSSPVISINRCKVYVCKQRSCTL